MNPTQAAQARHAENEKWGRLAQSVIVPGGFFLATVVGGWEDRKTGIKFPGPKANVDPNTREIIGLCDLPDPVQLPTHRLVTYDVLPEYEKRQVTRSDARARGERERFKVTFDCLTLDEETLGILLAIRTGTIRHVDEYEMTTTFPTVWANRQDELVLGSTVEQRVQQPDTVRMLDELMNSRRTSLAAEAASRKK